MAWDSTMRFTPENKTDLQMAHIVFSRFTNGDTKDGTKYSLGGLYVHPVTTMVSKKALGILKTKFGNEILAENGIGIDYHWVNTKFGKVSKEVTREHVIPIEALYQYFLQKYRVRELSEQTILDFMPKLHIAIIAKEENAKLKERGLNKKMPEGWWETSNHDPLERYRQAGLGDSIWADFESSQTATPQLEILSNRDYVEFTLKDPEGNDLLAENGTIGKSRLVEAVIKHYCETHDNLTLAGLQMTFPKELQRHMDVVTFNPRDPNRYFKRTVVWVEDKPLYICNQWGRGGGIDNTENFITKARELGYQIERIER